LAIQQGLATLAGVVIQTEQLGDEGRHMAADAHHDLALRRPAQALLVVHMRDPTRVQLTVRGTQVRQEVRVQLRQTLGAVQIEEGVAVKAETKLGGGGERSVHRVRALRHARPSRSARDAAF